jgi:diguanylate cyclase (GGDEF)-like protein
LGDPLGWTAADKCLLIVGIMLPGVAMFALLGHLVPNWLYLPPELHRDAMQFIDRLTLLAAGTWTTTLVVGLILRRRAPENRVFVIVTVLHYSLTIAIYVCLSGAFHSSGWILFLGGAVVGFLLFGRTLTLLGIALFAATFGGAMWASEAGYLGDLILVTHPPPAHSAAWEGWLIRMGISTLVFGGMTLALCSYVISLLRDREARLDLMSKTDGLTSLVNRRHFMSLLDAELKRGRRYQHSVAVVMVDLDYFKKINDAHGHLTGDRVLVAVSTAMAEAVRDTDVVARYGGEEFVLLLPNTDRDGARELAERCRELIAATQIADERGLVEVTASLGIAAFPSDVSDPSADALLGAADAALYQAKEDGRNRVVLAEPKAA